ALHGRDEDVFDVDPMTLPGAARLIAADHEDGWNVEAPRGHQVRGRCLVARREADHAIELCAFHGDLDVVHDEVATREDVTSGMRGADDEIARRRGPNLKRDTARGADLFLDDPGDAVEVAEADCKLRGAVDD